MLTEREQEIIELIGKGLSNKEIAESLFISVKTVETHCMHINQKLGVKNRFQAYLAVSSLNIN